MEKVHCAFCHHKDREVIIYNADLEGSQDIDVSHIAEALQYRPKGYGEAT